VQRREVFILALGGLLIAGFLAAGVVLYEPADADGGTVVLYDDEERVATIDAEIADEWKERTLGLSAHESLPDDEGMLFVYESPGNHTYVMREMDFGIDIVYVDERGCITSVNPAPEPGPNEVGENQRYPGYGQYVIEVPIGVASDAGIEAGDPVRIEYENATVDGRDAGCFES